LRWIQIFLTPYPLGRGFFCEAVAASHFGKDVNEQQIVNAVRIVKSASVVTQSAKQSESLLCAHRFLTGETT